MFTPAISSTINEWAKASGPFSFEIRLHRRINTERITELTPPFIFMVFIIDVNGFFIDKEHTMPIKLHRERVISIDRFNTDPQYAEDFRKDLKLFTDASYEEFHQYLASFATPIYTSDPLYMKV